MSKVETKGIKDAAVTEAKLANGAVGASKVGSGALDSAGGLEMSSGTVRVKDDSRTGDTISVHRDSAGAFVSPAADFDGDHLDVDWNPSNSTPTTTGASEAADVDDLTAHLKGIDNRFGALAAADDMRVEYHKVTAGEVTAGSFTIAATPRSAGEVVVTKFGSGGLQANAALNVSGQTADYEASGTTVKINASSSPSETLTGTIVENDVLQVMYPVAP